MLIPDKVSESGDTVSRGDGASTDDFESDICTGSPSPSSSSQTSPAHIASGSMMPTFPVKSTSPVMDDLDLLPTKEEPVRLSKLTNEKPVECSGNGGNCYFYYLAASMMTNFQTVVRGSPILNVIGKAFSIRKKDCEHTHTHTLLTQRSLLVDKAFLKYLSR